MVNVILTWWSEAVLTHSVLSGIISSLSVAVGPRGCFKQTAVWCLVVIGSCRITDGNVGYIILSVLIIQSWYREN